MNKIQATLVLAAAVTLAVAPSTPAWADNWPSAGGNLKNTRHQASEVTLSVSNVANLLKKWEITTDGDVTASPSVDNGALYFPDSAGFLYKVDAASGNVMWKMPIANYTNTPNDFARATPAVWGNSLILGSQSGRISCSGCTPAAPKVFAVDKTTGAALWATQVDDLPSSFVTAGAIVSNGTVYVGLASNEELLAAFVPKAYWTWQFRGSVVALDAKTGVIKWKTYTVPTGYYGGSVWGSTPALDTSSNTLYVATGDNFWAPVDAVNCVKSGGAPEKCLAPDDYADSIIAINADTGRVKWGQRGLPYDVWSVACGLNIPGVFTVPAMPDNCPAVQGPDYDFAQGPMLFTDKDGTLLVGAGQKSGMFWAFKAGSGKLAWSRQVAPGGVTGGMQWGSASDGQRVYVTASNAGPTLAGGGAGSVSWTLADGSTTYGGGWAALDRSSGVLQWTRSVPGAEALPTMRATYGTPLPFPQGFRVEGAPLVANGVVYGCDMQGVKYAMSAASGQVLWSLAAPPNPYYPYSCNASATVADGALYWGSGTFTGYGPHTFTKYTLNGQ